MIRYHAEMPSLPVKELCGGEGEARMTLPFDRGVLPKNIVCVTLAPGASCGEHTHETDGEVFFILEGELTLIEDGQEYVLHPGDCEYCADGHSHGVVNRSDRPGVYLAVMVK